jgi:hypothetical protein
MLPGKKSSVILLSVLLMGAAVVVHGQVRISSPYSRYGLGELQGNRFAHSMAMGGIGYAVRDPHMVNMKNPASYSGFDTLSFICEIGLTSNFTQLQTMNTIQGFNDHSTLGYLLFGFPVTRWCGAAVGLVPYSKTGYKLIVNDTIDNIGKVKGQYEGSGNINRFFIGSGFKLHRDLSFGFNASFLFGKNSNIGSVYFQNLTYAFNTRVTHSTVINDFNFEAGLQYHHTLKNGLFINGGLVYEIPFNMNARKTYLVERFTTTSTGDVDVVQDTVENIANEKGKVYLPGGIGGGFALGKKDIWMVGLDVSWQNWDRFRSFGQKDSLRSGIQSSAGFLITPQHNSVSNYFKKISYRAGFRYDNTYLTLHGQPINEYAVSLGFNFPIRKASSSINLALEYGQRGTTNDNLIKETFVRATLGFAIKELWFFRRKLD